MTKPHKRHRHKGEAPSGIINSDQREKASKKKLPQGFTLVEVIVTMIVLSFGCIAVLHMQSSSLRGSSKSDYITVATFLAESETERLKALNFEDLTEEIQDGTVVTKKFDRAMRMCQAKDLSSCDKFPFTVVTRFFPHFPTSFSHQAEVEVSWRDQTGNHKVIAGAAMTDLSF
jgi:prepilin-type N-terminal cleavage/methylation domain-containing protein